MKIYHYRKLNRWPEEKEGLQRYPNLGLRAYANTRVDGVPAIFGLLDPMPEKWVNSKDFPGVWDNLIFNTGRLLLMLDVDEKQDDVFVCDQGYMRDVIKGNISAMDGTRTYLDSMVPIGEYIRREGDLNYSLPEVVIKGDVGLGKIQIPTSQPKLEELVERCRRGYNNKTENRFSEFDEETMVVVRKIPELQPWYLDYLARNPEVKNELKIGIGEGIRNFRERFF